MSRNQRPPAIATAASSGTGAAVPVRPPLLPTPPPSWVDRISVDAMARVPCPRSVAPSARPAWLAAVDRTARLFNALRASTIRPGQADTDRAVKLLLLLPKVCAARWAGRNRSPALSRELTAVYPHLPDHLAAAVVAGFARSPEPRPPDGPAARTKAVERHLRQGHVRKAAQVLQSEGLAKMDAAGLAALDALHPSPVKPGKPVSTGHLPAFRPRPGGPTLSVTVAKAPRSSCPGPSGWTFDHTRLAWTLGAFQDALTGLVNGMLADRDVPLADWLRASAVIPLLKKGGSGIRPIAIGESWVRLAAKVALGSVDPEGVLLPEQFGVGSRGGVEPIIWSIQDSIGELGPRGALVQVDWANAFNTLCRHATAKALAEEPGTRHLLGVYRFLYNTPSALLVPVSDGSTATLWSKTGGRQGDPLFPFLFSVTVRPLVRRLREVAAPARVVSPEGDLSPRKRLWAYLDDMDLLIDDAASYAAIIDELRSPAVRDVFGLAPNVGKCRCTGVATLAAEGVPALGSWVGGPSTPDSPASALTRDAAATLASRVKLLDPLPLHHRLVVLRSCWHPALNHLLRTLHPAVGQDGARRFDDTIAATIQRYADDPSPSPDAPLLWALPRSLGGLGLFRQERVHPIAAAASLIQASGVLDSRGMPLSRRTTHGSMGPAVQACARELDLPPDALLGPDHWSDPRIQRRALALGHEREWLGLFDRLTDPDRIRLLEGSGAAARAWLDATPIQGLTLLSDEQARYALRRAGLSRFTDLSPQARCPHCPGTPDTPSHHLLCSIAQPQRTLRHTAIKAALATKMAEGGRPVDLEVPVGYFTDDRLQVHRIIADIVGVIDARLERVDVSIAGIPPPATPILWPTAEVVAASLSSSRRAAAGQGAAALRWDDRLEEGVHPRVLEAREFRALAMEAAILPAIRAREGEKRSHYQKGHVTVWPFVISAVGVVGPAAKALIDAITFQRHPGDAVAQATFRSHLLHRISVILVQHGSRMASSRLGRSPCA